MSNGESIQRTCEKYIEQEFLGIQHGFREIKFPEIYEKTLRIKISKLDKNITEENLLTLGEELSKLLNNFKSNTGIRLESIEYDV